MSCNILKHVAVFIVCILYVGSANAQNFISDTSSQQEIINNTVQNFTAKIGEQSRLYNGPEYYQYNPAIKGNAYYNDKNVWQLGSVCYDHVTYTNVPMMYDIFKDCVVILHPNKAFRYSLLNDKLLNFNLLDHHFVYINVDSLKNSVVANGIYSQLYNGTIEVLAKTSKSIQNNITISNNESYFTSEKKNFYLKKGNVYYRINNEASILKALQDKKEQVQLFIRGNGINYRKEPEQALIRIASYYDHLTN